MSPARQPEYLKLTGGPMTPLGRQGDGVLEDNHSLFDFHQVRIILLRVFSLVPGGNQRADSTA